VDDFNRSPSAPDAASLDGVTMNYRAGVAAVEGISARFAEGAFVSLVGPSGCGKTTLLKLLAGLLSPTAGRVRVGGVDPRGGLEAGFLVFQEPTLLPWLRVRENIALPLRLRGVEAPERERRIDHFLGLVGLEGAATRFPHELSLGMQMRVSVARALATRPRFLFLDEPFGAVDEFTRNQLNEDLLRLREEHPFTAFFVTHSVAEAVFLASEVLVLAGGPGRVVQRCPVEAPFPRGPEWRESEAYLRQLAAVSQALRGAKEASA
jgi:NitT/TauT family transport system ATP-binding protein